MPSNPRFWLHVNAVTRDAHVLLVDVPQPRAPATVTTTVYRDVMDLADLISLAVFITRARAITLLSDASLAGTHDLWFGLDRADFNDMPNRLAVMNLVGESADGFIREGRKVLAYVGNGAFLDVTRPVPSAVLEPTAQA